MILGFGGFGGGRRSRKYDAPRMDTHMMDPHKMDRPKRGSEMGSGPWFSRDPSGASGPPRRRACAECGCPGPSRLDEDAGAWMCADCRRRIIDL